MQVRIIGVPPGEAPLHIRRAWVGLILPVFHRTQGPIHCRSRGVLSMRESWFEPIWRRLTGRPAGTLQYMVPTDDALDVLEASHPDAAEWWLKNAPHLFGVGGLFGFAAEVCEEV